MKLTKDQWQALFQEQAPDLLKTLPTGVGAVLIAHGIETPHGASSVFKIRFPELRNS